jgi:hypothetical protein
MQISALADGKAEILSVQTLSLVTRKMKDTVDGTLHLSKQCEI